MTSIAAFLGSAPGILSDTSTYRPQIWPASDLDTLTHIKQAVATGQLRQVHDTYLEQHRELCETRHPELDASDPRVDAITLDSLGDTPPSRLGNWILFPWSGRLVHLLSEAEFRELRTSRNRNKISANEQERLRRLRIGIVGLSVGMATAQTLVTEEIGGTFVLADFDSLSLSNLNRVRATVCDISFPKCIVIARQICEINPYANVVLFPVGLDDSNLSDFLGMGEERLDLVFEECDDLYMKIRIREEARVRRIPVLMETSERGMLDIERYDLEPTRPILHGLVDGCDPRQLQRLTNAEKVPLLLRILGEEELSPRSAASMLEIGATLRTWPQLASAVALGGAVTADVARRIALGQMAASGRFHVDLERLVADGHDTPLELAEEPLTTTPEAKRLPALPTLQPRRQCSANVITALVGYATLAPSGGNCQPWRFEYQDSTLHVYHDVGRSRSYLDFEHRAAYLALGAAIENLELAAAQAGLTVLLKLFPQAPDLTRIGELRFVNCEGATPARELFDQIGLRVTNRRLSRRVPFEVPLGLELEAEAKVAAGHLQLITDPLALDSLGSLLGKGDRLRFGSPIMHREMMNEIRWTRQEVERTRDGLDLMTLELTPTEAAALRLSARANVIDLVIKVGGGSAFEKPSRKALVAASAAGLVTAPGMTPASYFTAGRAMQRVWLKATALGYAFQPLTSITYLFARLEAKELRGLSSSEVDLLHELREAYLRIFPGVTGSAEGMLFRLSRAAPPTARALRRPVTEVLRIG